MAVPVLLVTGATGLVGSALGARRAIVGLPRGGAAPLRWDPQAGVVDDGRTIGAVVHLAGAGVADSRWTPERKKVLWDSRIVGTRTLVDWLIARRQRPEVLVSVAAVGIYGSRGDDELTEDSSPGSGFLAGLCQAWEAEAERAREAGLRVVVLRLGVVLDADGGALAKMLPPWRLGLGGPVGGGRQWFPWIHIHDAVGGIEAALSDPTWSGAYNLVAPGVVRQADFATALGAALGRPARIPSPVPVLKLALGSEMVDETLLASQRVVPRAMVAAGYGFRFPALAPALADLVGITRSR
jgi:uncharacterized protein